MELEVAVLSRAGGRAVNEDACGFWSGAGICFCVLSDGAGGHGGGDVASKVVVQEMLGWFRDHTECSFNAVYRALGRANDAVVREQQSGSAVATMRATAVVLATDFENGIASWGHLGDSRLYCFRNGVILKQTRDHSLVQHLIDAGFLDPHQLRSSPERSKLLKALGDSENFEPAVEALFSVKAHDRFLMCSDGLWEYVEERELERTLGEATSAEQWLRALETLVVERGGERQDNYSALAVWCQP